MTARRLSGCARELAKTSDINVNSAPGAGAAGGQQPPAPLAGGVALGVCVHFIASSGLAKLHVAAAGKGVRAGVAAWCLIRVGIGLG